MTEEWQTRPLGDLLLRVPRYGINAPGSELTSGAFTYLRITDIDDAGRFWPDSIVSVLAPGASEYLMAPGELVFARTGASVGKSYLYDPKDGELVYAGFLINVAPDPDQLDAGYLAQFVRTEPYWNWVHQMSARSGQPGINGTEYRELPVPLPPIEEQRRIAEVLDDADALIASLERTIAKKEAVKQGMMQQLLTGRTRLPGFTTPWQTHRLGDHVVYLRTVPLSRAQLDTSSPIKYLHYGDIHTSDAVLLDAANAPMQRADSARTATADHLRPGDLVLVDASEDLDGVCKSVEVTSVPPGGVVAGLHTIAARFSQAVFADGYKAFLQFLPEFRTQVRRIAAGTKVVGVSASRLAEVELSLPSVAEQRAIAGVLTDADDEIRALRVRLDKARAIKGGMMQQLLTGRIRLPIEEAA